eukprot:COSAG05_NODE_1_length_66591_cov_307.301581_4_plen_96_part_00
MNFLNSSARSSNVDNTRLEGVSDLSLGLRSEGTRVEDLLGPAELKLHPQHSPFVVEHLGSNAPDKIRNGCPRNVLAGLDCLYGVAGHLVNRCDHT